MSLGAGFEGGEARGMFKENNKGENDVEIANKLLNKWSYRCYIAGFAVMVLAAIFIMGSGNKFNQYFDLVSYFGSFLFGFGFVLWMFSQFRKLPVKLVGRLAALLLHGLVILLAIVPARRLVAESIGLPPQDFDLTVAICAVILYVPVWSLIAGFAMLLIYAAMLVFAVGLHICGTFISYVISPVLDVFASNKFSSRAALTKNLAKKANMTFGHSIGAAVFSVMMVSGWQWSFLELRKLSKPVVLFVAYVVDYQFVPKYPGIDHSKKARLHENGVVSYAKRDGYNVTIEVRNNGS